MSLYTKRAARIMKHYDLQIRKPDVTKEDAIDSAIKRVYPTASEDAQADIYGYIGESFDKFPTGVARRISITGALRKYHGARRAAR